MTQKTKHSPLPWHLAKNEVKYCINSGNRHVNMVSSYVAKLGDELENEANADFIVRACNAHYEAITLIDELQNAAFEYAHPDTIAKARAWLTKAR